MENNEMILHTGNELDIVGALNDNSALWASMPLDSHEAKIAAYNAVNQADTTLKENVNKPIKMTDVIVSVGSQVDDDGNINQVPRICIFDADGTTYHAMSWGVYRSICRIRSLFGTLHFDDPITIIPVEMKTKNGFSMTLKIQ